MVVQVSVDVRLLCSALWQWCQSCYSNAYPCHSTGLKKCMAVQVSVDVPDQKGRLEILQVHARNKKLNEDVDLKEVASRVPGFTGADLANLLNEVSHLCNQSLII